MNALKVSVLMKDKEPVAIFYNSRLQTVPRWKFIKGVFPLFVDHDTFAAAFNCSVFRASKEWASNNTCTTLKNYRAMGLRKQTIYVL